MKTTKFFESLNEMDHSSTSTSEQKRFIEELKEKFKDKNIDIQVRDSVLATILNKLSKEGWKRG